jgi:hypothetical protein
MKTYTPKTSNDFLNDPTILDEPLASHENGTTTVMEEPYLGEKLSPIIRELIARQLIPSVRPIKRIAPKE